MTLSTLSIASNMSSSNLDAPIPTVSSPPRAARNSNSSSSPSKRKSTSLPAETVDYLKAWMMSPEHIAHPYPTEQEKTQIMADTGIELKQLTNWFVNNRKRYWKPRVEARLQQQGQLPTTTVSSPPIKRKNSSQQLSLVDVGDDRPLSSMTRSVSKDRIHKVVSSSALAPAAGTLQQEGLLTAEVAPTVRRVSIQAIVSDASSSSSLSSYASDSGSVVSSNDDTDFCYESSNEDVASMDGSVARTETVDVHILRPLNGNKPTIADVSILSTVPTERILCTYENCSLSYRFPVDSIQDRKKVQSRRDAEIVRLKRQFLKLYLEEHHRDEALQPLPNPQPKRSLQEVDEKVENTPRKKFCCESPKLWKQACEAAAGLYDHDLPTLEEATLLFGFSRGIGA